MAILSFVTFAVALLVAAGSTLPSNKITIKVHDDCKDKEGFCSLKPEGYDEIEERINRLLPLHVLSLGDRSGGPTLVETDEDNCPSRMTKRQVFTHRDNQTRLDILVNTKLFPQSINEITCISQKSGTDEAETQLDDDSPQCFKNLGLYHDKSLRFRCQTTNAMRTLLVYDPDVNELKYKNYPIPVCCSCHITKV